MQSPSTASLQSPVIRAGTLVQVHETRFTCDVVLDIDDRYLTDIPLTTLYLHRDGHGIYVMPEVGTRVQVIQPSDDEQYHVLGFLPENEAPTDQEELDPVTEDYRMRRPAIQSGDYVLSTRGGSHAILRRNGVLELGSTPAAKRFYIPLGNLIRDFAETYELQTSAGTLLLGDDRDVDPGELADKVPALLQLHVRKFTDEVPSVRLDAGYVHDLQQRTPPGGSSSGAVVWRLQVGDPHDSRLSERDAFSANYDEQISQDGTKNVRSDGHHLWDVEKTFLIRAGQFEQYSSGDHIVWAEGNFTRKVEGGSDDWVAKDTFQRVGGSVSRLVGGDVAELVEGGYDRKVNNERRHVQGPLVDRVDEDRAVMTLGSAIENVGKDFNKTIGQKMEMVVTNKDAAGTGARMLVHQGALVIRDSNGTVDVQSGGSESVPHTRLELPSSGSMKLRWAQQQGFLIGATDGAWRLGNGAGFIKMNPLGEVQIGPGAAGYVVTTQTLPETWMYTLQGSQASGYTLIPSRVVTKGVHRLAVAGQERSNPLVVNVEPKPTTDS